MMSIAIPTYETFGKGKEYLRFQFEKFLNQTFKDFEVVISDQSADDEIKKVCDEYSDRLNIFYFRNEDRRGLSSGNVNNAIRNCKREIIKILFLDDFLWDKNSLKYFVDAFTEETNWVVSACEHTRDDGKSFYRTFYPKYNHNIHLGFNTISSPSVLAFRNAADKMYFDERLVWLMDVDFYKRLYIKYGEPTLLNKITVVNRTHDKQMGTITENNVKRKEYDLMWKKYGFKIRGSDIRVFNHIFTNWKVKIRNSLKVG